MSNKISISCKNNGEKIEIPQGTNLIELSELLNINTTHKIVAAKVNNKTESLRFRLYEPKKVEFIDITQEAGMRCYVRSLCFILSKAVADLYPKLRINIRHSLSNGYFFSIDSMNGAQEPDINAIKQRMQELIKEDIDFIPTEDETDKVVALFREKRFEDKALLLETSDSIYSKYYHLGDYTDYFYGALVPSSGYISLFDIEPIHDGYLLRIPDKKNPDKLAPKIDQPKLYKAYNEYTDLLNTIGLKNVGDMNRANQINRMSDIIKISEAIQEKKIAEFANIIKSKFEGGVRIVLIAGPSSSGKTTFRKRLEIQLMTNLIKPVGLSLDDYFVNRENTPLDENGEYDFESLYALDIEQFNNDLNTLLKGEEVPIPSFNFTTGKREYKGHTLKIDNQSVLVIEGIHGLNPSLTEHIDNSRKFLIYVSALTPISLDQHNWISTSDNRLLRRLIRDYKYRNYSAIDTLSRWPSVRKGEDKWIFPYQENADLMFNSAMIYELAAIKKYAIPILLQVPKKAPEYAEAYRLLKLLSYFCDIDDKELPPTSLLREFVGGSSFKY